MLHDPTKTAILPVTLLEELPVAETEELIRLVKEDLGMPLGPLFLNRVRREIFTPHEAERLMTSKAEISSSDAVEQTLALGARRATAESTARRLTARLESQAIPLIEVPDFVPEPAGAEGLAALAAALAEGPPPSYRASRP
jgi:hypothetical protein